MLSREDLAVTDGVRLSSLLESLAEEPLERRVPFLGLLRPLLQHADARVRAAAYATLAGAVGPHAFPALVSGLDDGDPLVRISALASLHESSAAQPARWAHAIFHQSPEVRHAALGAPPPTGAEGLAFYLLADPDSAAQVRAAGVRVPPTAISAVLSFAADGTISHHEARTWIAAIPMSRMVGWLDRSYRRTPTEIDRILAAAGDTTSEQRDALDDLFLLFLDEDADEALQDGFFTHFEGALFSSNFPRRRRAIAALLTVFRKKRWFLPRAAGICALFFPQFMLAKWIPRDVRHGALTRLYAHGRRVPRINDDQLEPFVTGDLVRPKGEKSRIDIWALGGVLHYCRNNPYMTAWRWLDPDVVIDTLLADIERSIPFLTLADGTDKGRKWLLAEVAKRAPDDRGRVLALLTLSAAADELAFLSTSPTASLLECLGAIFALARGTEVRIARNKLDRIADIMGAAFVGDHAAAFFEVLLSHPSPAESDLATAVLGAFAKHESAERWLELALGLPTNRLRKLIELLPFATTVPWGKELALAHALVDHISPTVTDWARSRLPKAGQKPKYARSASLSLLTPAVERNIVDATEAELHTALATCLGTPHRGLTDALLRRPAPTRPSPEACVALLGSHDDMQTVAACFETFGSRDGVFLAAVTELAVEVWLHNENLPAIGHAFFHRFERHAFILADVFEAREDGFAAALTEFGALASPRLRDEGFASIARLCAIFRFRDKPRLERHIGDALFSVAVDALATDVGMRAAQILMSFYEARLGLGLLSGHRERVTAELPDYDDGTRMALERWVSSSGLPARAVAARVHRGPSDEELIRSIRGEDDLEVLAEHCWSTDPKIVHEAALRLLTLGEGGRGRLIGLLEESELPEEWRAIADSVSLFPEGPAIARLAAIANGGGTPELVFRVALGLAERGDLTLVAAACRAARQPTDTYWLRSADATRLRKLTASRAFGRELCTSPHPHAYRPAVEFLLALTEDEDRESEPSEGAREHREGDLAALRSFLEQGTTRIGDLRRRAAARLLKVGDTTGYPLLVSELFRGEEVDLRDFVTAAPELLSSVVQAALFAGQKRADERKLLPLLDHEATPRPVRDSLLELLLTECADNGLRQAVVGRLARRPSRARKLAAVADTFAWGVRVGRELTGRMFRFHLIGGRGLGYTRLNENRIFVSPLPLLRGARHGREIVEALVLHEVGHHVYHRGEAEAAVWVEAQKDGVGGLLNLVADEHLERNLRAVDASYGNRLKRLASYAFAHSARELRVDFALEMLQHRSFEVLTRIKLGVARDPASVRIDNGALLSEMERSGLRFAKFVRALRMGLGRRHGDALVDEALEMFDKSFRKGDMRSLLAITYRLRELFGAEVQIVECFGGHETLGDGEADGIIHGEGIDDDELQREIERVLDPRAKKGSGAGQPGGKLLLNVNPDEHFNPITQIQKVPYDAARHREESLRVARQSRHMRRYLHDLGLSLVPQRMRLRGRRFDRSRALAVVSRRDPRMLIARETRRTTDLFLGIIVDCSGSMQGRSMERARAFGVLLADAARGLPGIDVRLFGFTDRIIYDAGDARRPAVASLEAGGGNNDAAALAHVAEVARGSKRRAKLLVMISDGLPTECSVAALRGLVTRLTRREGMSCAQVAVRPLAEKCFPHYVEVMDDEFDVAVRRFGTIIAGLVKKALGA